MHFTQEMITERRVFLNIDCLHWLTITQYNIDELDDKE